MMIQLSATSRGGQGGKFWGSVAKAFAFLCIGRDAEAKGDAIDEAEVGGDEDGFQDSTVGEGDVAELLDVVIIDGLGGLGEFGGEVEDGALALIGFPLVMVA